MRRALALALLLVALPAPADIVLEGYFHTGDEDTRPEFTPADPVDCTKYRTYPTRFHLTQSATITGFTLHDAVDLDDTDITIDLDGTQRSARLAACLQPFAPPPSLASRHSTSPLKSTVPADCRTGPSSVSPPVR